MKKIVVRVGVVTSIVGAILALVFAFSTHFSLADRPLRPPPALQTPALQGGGADSCRGSGAILVSPSGHVALFDRAGGGVTRFRVDAGTPVTMVNCVRVGAGFWFLVELGDGAQGWVPGEMLSVPGATRPTFSAFRFCSGSAQGPGDDCGQLSLAAAALWMQYDYAGLQPTDTIQWVVVVGKDRYSSAPQPWDGPRAGQHLYRLDSLGPRREAGSWLVWLVVNGELAATTRVRVQ